jgi:hypothetical protein
MATEKRPDEEKFPDKLLDEYLSRGRRFQSLDVQALEQRWFAANQKAKSTAGQRDFDAMQEMNHIEAELHLRGLKPPAARLN